MIISSQPADYSPAYNDLIYTLAQADPNQAIEVEILGGPTITDVLGVKRLSGQSSYEVNIAPYLRTVFDPRPRWTAGFLDGQPAGLLWMYGGIRAGSLSSTFQWYLPGVKTKKWAEVLSDSPMEHTIAPGECVEIAVDFRRFSLHYDYIKSMGGVYEPYPATLDCETRRFICVDGRPKGAVRLCWQNPYGAMDYHTFYKSDKQFASERRLARDAYGANVACMVDSAIFTTLHSDWESADNLAWLAQIITSPRVWICEGSAFRRVDVVTDTTAPLTDAAPDRLEITICERRKIYQ